MRSRVCEARLLCILTFIFRLNMENIREYSMEYCRSHETLLRIWIMLCTLQCGKAWEMYANIDGNGVGNCMLCGICILLIFFILLVTCISGLFPLPQWRPCISAEGWRCSGAVLVGRLGGWGGGWRGLLSAPITQTFAVYGLHVWERARGPYRGY